MADGRDSSGSDASRPAETVAVSQLDELDPSPRRRRGPIVVALLALVAVVGVAVAIVATAPDGDDEHRAEKTTVETPEALKVFAALGTTTAAGSYNATYEFHSTPGQQSSDPSSCDPPKRTVRPDGSEELSQSCIAIGAGSRSPVTITGVSTINTDPYRMRSVSSVTGFGEITVRVDGTRLWETGGGNYGMTGPPGDRERGAPISGFADLVEGTLGQGPGALTMLTLASPNGYLNLQKEAVSGVTAAGTGVVDGVAVTYFDVVVQPAKLLDVPGLTGEQAKTIREALARLESAGYRGTTTRVGIDAAGLIRETSSVATFEDGTRQSNHTVLSNFGCAGIVHLPGDPPSTAVDAPCASTTPTAPSTTLPLPPPTVPASATTVPPSSDPSPSVSSDASTTSTTNGAASTQP